MVYTFLGIMGNDTHFCGDNGKWYTLSPGLWEMVHVFSGIMGNGKCFLMDNGKRYALSGG